MDPDRQQLIQELRQRVNISKLDPDYDDENGFNLLRWLKGYNNDLDSIVPRLEETLEFRRAMAFDKLGQQSDNVIDSGDFRLEFSENLRQYYPGGLAGFDKAGNVIVFEPSGRCDPRGLLPLFRCSEFLRWRLYETEHIYRMIRRREKELGKKLGVLLIGDLDGLTMDQIYPTAMSVYTNIATLLQAHYPDLLAKVLLINVPGIVNIAYRMIQPFLSKNTRSKIEFVNGDRKTWQARLFELADEDQIPEFWGGTMTGEFGQYGNVVMGGKVPPELKPDFPVLPKTDLVTFTVSRGTAETVPFTVKPHESAVFWYFTAAGGDVEFGVRIKPSSSSSANNNTGPDGTGNGINSGTVWKVPKLRIYTELVPEYGRCKLEPNDYELVFDNSYSWLRAKTISYHLKIS